MVDAIMLSTEQVAELLGCSKRSASETLKQQNIKPFRIGKENRYSKAEVLKIIGGNETMVTPTITEDKTEREKRLDGLETELYQRRDAIDKREDHIREKDNELGQREAEVTQREQAIASEKEKNDADYEGKLATVQESENRLNQSIEIHQQDIDRMEHFDKEVEAHNKAIQTEYTNIDKEIAVLKADSKKFYDVLEIAMDNINNAEYNQRFEKLTKIYCEKYGLVEKGKQLISKRQPVNIQQVYQRYEPIEPEYYGDEYYDEHYENDPIKRVFGRLFGRH